MQWMTWDDVSVRGMFGEMDSDDVLAQSESIISEACQVASDDLSGYMDVQRIIAENGVPEQLKRLATYKARELASIAYFGNATNADKNPSAEYHRSEYLALIESIRNGNVQVVGYERPNSQQFVRFT